MGDEEEGLDVLEEELLQPDDGIDIQMVGRLVQEQDVGVRDQGPGQERAAFGAAGKGGELRIRVEGEPAEDPLHLLVQGPPSGLFQLLLEVSPAASAAPPPPCRQEVADMVVLGQQFRRVSHPSGHHVEDRPGDPLGDLLGDQRHPQPLLAGNLSPFGQQARR